MLVSEVELDALVSDPALGEPIESVLVSKLGLEFVFAFESMPELSLDVVFVSVVESLSENSFSICSRPFSPLSLISEAIS